MKERRVAIPALGVAALLALAAPAGAATRFAEPNGDGPSGAGQCAEADPCSLADAIEAPSVADGDEVILLPGTTSGAYEPQTDTLSIDNAVTVGSRPTDPVPAIPVVGAGNGGFSVESSGGLIRRLRIEADAASAFRLLSGGTAEQVFARSVGENQAPCQLGLGGNALIRDSVCLATGEGGEALVWGLHGAASSAATLRNVTAVATGAGGRGIRVDAGAPMVGAEGADLTLSAVNVIARGEATDVRAETDGSNNAAAVIFLSSSNYDSISTSGPDTFIPAAGTGANQTAPPAFVDASGGDLHQAAGSPTIDAGDASASLLGTLDLDGDPRILGPAPDIGADEALPITADKPVPPPAGSSADTSPPDTKIIRRPKEKSKKRRATFAFTSTEPGSRFECKIDKRRFQPCASPRRVRVGKGKHRFTVRAIDATGNADPTPATDTWKVKAKRRAAR